MYASDVTRADVGCIEAFVISMPSAVARHGQVARIRATCGLPSTVIAATDGRAMTVAERRAVYARCLHRPSYPFELSPGEIGAFMSHRMAWSCIADSGLDAGLVLEDDIELDGEHFPRALGAAIAALRDYPLVRLSCRAPAGTPGAAASVRRPCVPPLGNTSQLVRRDAALRLLELSARFDRPVDTFEQMTWLHGLRVAVVEPSGVREVSSRIGGTTIHPPRRGTLERLARNPARTWYRLRARLLAMRAYLAGSRPVSEH